MMSQPTNPLSTIKEICGHLHIGKTSFYRLARNPGFPSAIRFNQKTVRYDLTEIVLFVNKQ
jgi:predicted DNA-binding transcriptional regulator AlpA